MEFDRVRRYTGVPVAEVEERDPGGPCAGADGDLDRAAAIARRGREGAGWVRLLRTGAGPPQVDLVVTKPGTKGDAHHRRAWELLLADDGLRDEYLRLKTAGMTSAEKRVFFEGVVRRLTD